MGRTITIYDPLKCRREQFNYNVEDFRRFDGFLEHIMKKMKYLPAEKCHTRLYLKVGTRRYKYITNMNEISEASESEITVIMLNIFDLSRGNVKFNCKRKEAADKIPRWHEALGKLKDVVSYIDDKENFEPTGQYEDMIEHILSNTLICKSLDVINKPDYLNIKLAPIPEHYTDDNVDDMVEDFSDFYCEQMYLLRKKFKKAIIKHRMIHVLRPDAPKEIKVDEENTIKITTAILKHVKDKESKDFGFDREEGYKLKQLGEGAFGSVSKCTFHGGITTVIKCIEFIYDNRDIFYKEIGTNRLLESTSHQNIIEYFKPALHFDNCGYIVMEYGGHSIESEYLKCDDEGKIKKGRQMEDLEILKAVNGVSSGLHHLHTLSKNRSKYVVHRDIRTANIVVNEHGIYKIIDFGISSLTTKLQSRVDMEDLKLGHYYWKSPEWLKTEDKDKLPGRMVDIWSLGFCILEMKAFPELPNCIKENRKCRSCDRQSKWIENVNDENWISKQISDHIEGNEIQDILKRCLEYDETKRCKAQELCEIANGYVEKKRKEEFKRQVKPGDKLTHIVMGDKKITITSEMLRQISNMNEDNRNLVVVDDCDCNISVLSSGAFGTAVRCNYSNVGDIVIKCIEIKSETAVPAEKEKKFEQNYNSFENELKCAIDLIKDKGNINIVQCFLPVLVYHNNFGFTLQEYGGISLDVLYFNKKVDGQDKKMNDKDIDKAIRDIANALKYLHNIDDTKRKYIIHKDVRTPNIVVDKEGPDGVYKLIDFGISCKTTDVNSRVNSVSIEEGHHYWKSPEFCYHTLRKQEDSAIKELAERKKPGRKADIWSFGIAILEMKSFPKRPELFDLGSTLSQTHFMEGLLQIAPQIIRRCNDLYEVKIIGQIEKLWQSQDNGPNVQKRIILNCLEYDEENRCSAQEILDNYE